MQIKTRQEAARDGDTTYSTGKPCKHGHKPVRYTCNGICVECTKANNAKLSNDLRTGRNNRMAGLFVYKLHPDDHAQALAVCQALDMQRGIVPKLAEPDTPPPITPEAIQQRRAWLINSMAPITQPHLPAP